MIWAVVIAVGVASIAAVSALAGAFHYLYLDRTNLPDLGPFTRFELPTIGHIYDVNGQSLVELARERRRITPYAEIPPVVRDAILAAEDKDFFSHNGVDYLSIPRIVGKVRLGAWLESLPWLGDNSSRDPAMFPQGGSTITQQLVRGLFLQQQMSRERSGQLSSPAVVPRLVSFAIGLRNTNMLLRKGEEIRLSFWVERRMRTAFGSKRRAKEEIFARYASFVYMGRGQYGFARASEQYLGRGLATLTTEDADEAALLAGIMKAPRDYAPTAKDTGPVLRRRNEILALMADEGFLSNSQLATARAQQLPAPAPLEVQPFRSSAVVEHVVDELAAANAGLGLEDLLQGTIQVHSTVDGRVQRVVSEALEHGLERYEARHPAARGVIQGSVVVLRNRDASVLAEAGGRQVYRGRANAYSDFNRVRRSLRQPGSAMKPIVYLAAFQRGGFSLDTLVPDAPISVPSGRANERKWIANYDGRFTGLIPVRKALAESRNAVAIWITSQIGIDAVIQASRRLGVRTPLQRYLSTALGASELNLLELATAYRTIASGVVAGPHVIRTIVRSGDVVPRETPVSVPVAFEAGTLALIQEGLRGVVRMPTGTAHALNSRAFPIAVMGKTGTTNEFRDALFVGSTYGLDGVTVAVRIGFDDNRPLGPKETGGRVALPVFQEIMLRVYQDELAGPAPSFPSAMEQRITRYLERQPPLSAMDGTPVASAGSESVAPSGSLALSRLSTSEQTAP